MHELAHEPNILPSGILDEVMSFLMANAHYSEDLVPSGSIIRAALLQPGGESTISSGTGWISCQNNTLFTS